MKKLLLVALLVALSPAIQAQNDQEIVDFYQSIFGMEKRAMVAEFVDLEGEESKNFWEIYDEYEITRKSQGLEKFKLLDDYITNYLSISDDNADDMMKKVFGLKKNNLKTLSKYHKKISKTNGGKVAAQFYQIENYFNNTIALSIMESIPFVGEMD